MKLVEVITDLCYFQVDETTNMIGHITHSGSDSGKSSLGFLTQGPFTRLINGLFNRFSKKNANFTWLLELEFSHEERSSHSISLRFNSQQEAIEELKNIVTQFKLKKTPITNLQSWVEDPRQLNLALTSQNEAERKIAHLVFQLVEKVEQQVT